jgi:hypothetical protein
MVRLRIFQMVETLVRLGEDGVEHLVFNDPILWEEVPISALVRPRGVPRGWRAGRGHSSY